MSEQPNVHYDKSGSTGKPRTQSTKLIHAQSIARDSFTKTLIGGAVMILLTIAYIVALFNKIDGAQNILVIVGSTLGFLLGGRDKNQSTDP